MSGRLLSMPKVVDAEQRRAELIRVSTRAVAKRGLAGLTLRNVARAGGWTTGIVSHYFADKDELLRATYEARADRARRAIDEAVEGGATLLEATISAALPLDDEGRTDWRVFVAYLGDAVGDARLAALHRRRAASFVATLADAVQQEIDAGRIPHDRDPAVEADRLHCLMTGIAVQAVFEPTRWSAVHQLAVVEEHLRSLRHVEP